MFRGRGSATPAGSRSPPYLPFRGGVPVRWSGVERGKKAGTTPASSFRDAQRYCANPPSDRGWGPLSQNTPVIRAGCLAPPAWPFFFFFFFWPLPPRPPKNPRLLGGNPRRKECWPFLRSFPSQILSHFETRRRVLARPIRGRPGDRRTLAVDPSCLVGPGATGDG